MRTIVLMGAPGSGKDTLADKLKDELNYDVLTTGAIYRKAAEEKTELGLRARDQYWGKGNLCPDEMTNEIMKNEINKTTSEVLVLNGYPRSIVQAKFLDSFLTVDLVINLVADEETLVNRLLKRNRADDSLEVIDRRLQVHRDNEGDLFNFYRFSNIWEDISSEGAKQDTFKLALQTIRSYCIY